MEKFNTTPEKVFPKQIEKLKAEGLLETDENEVRLTKKGELWKGNIAWEFAPQAKA
jgi:coproporphyrinogen III oxidase-like Fe-S oxidoreductase